MVLKDIAKINIGLVISRLPKDESGWEGRRYNYFTLSSAEHGQTIDETKLKELTTYGNINAKYLSRKGDIIIGLSSPHSTAYIDNESIGIIIPSQFALIRADGNKILPEYLIAYLGSEAVRHQIESMAKGVAVMKFDLNTLADLPVRLPPMQKQKQIARLHSLIKEENQLNYLYAKLAEKRNNYYLNELIERKGESE